MFRLAMSMIAALVIIGGLSRTVLAEDAKCEGTITKIEGEKVTVKTATNEEHQLTVVPSTKIMVDGKAAKQNDLKTGYKVKCAASKDGNKLTCNSIDATTKAN